MGEFSDHKMMDEPVLLGHETVFGLKFPALEICFSHKNGGTLSI
jgi:hypothetical protein